MVFIKNILTFNSFGIDGNIDDWKQFHTTLDENRVEVLGVVDHGIAYGVYFLDPDGHHLEVFYPRFSDDAESKAEVARIDAIANPIEISDINGYQTR